MSSVIFGFGGPGAFSGVSGIFSALQNPLRLWMYESVCCAISRRQSGHCTICFDLSVFFRLFCFNLNYWCFFKWLYWFFCDSYCSFSLGLALGLGFSSTSSCLISSCLITYSLIYSFMGSSLLIISSISSRVSLIVLAIIYIILAK